MSYRLVSLSYASGCLTFWWGIVLWLCLADAAWHVRMRNPEGDEPEVQGQCLLMFQLG
jgi:hypothetical protein